jgi:WD40 repeat protein
MLATNICTYNEHVYIYTYVPTQAATHVRLFRGHSHCVDTLAISDDSNIIVSGSSDKSIKMWYSHTGKLMCTLCNHDDVINSVHLSTDGKLMASAGGYLGAHKDNAIRIWDLTGIKYNSDSDSSSEVDANTREVADSVSVTNNLINQPSLLHVLTQHGHSVSCVRFSPDSQRLASTSRDGSVMVWNPRTGQQLQVFTAHEGGVRCAAWSPDSKHVASGGDDKSVRMWDAGRGTQLIEPLHGHAREVTCVSFCSNASTLVSASGESIIVWKLRGGVRAAMSQKIDVQTFWVKNIALSPDDVHVAGTAGYGKAVTVWDVATGQFVRALQGHKKAVVSVAWSSDGQYIVTGSDDDTIRMWRARVQVHCVASCYGSVCALRGDVACAMWRPQMQVPWCLCELAAPFRQL